MGRRERGDTAVDVQAMRVELSTGFGERRASDGEERRR